MRYYKLYKNLNNLNKYINSEVKDNFIERFKILNNKVN